jgi:hypothetical protein
MAGAQLVSTEPRRDNENRNDSKAAIKEAWRRWNLLPIEARTFVYGFLFGFISGWVITR